ncbi:Fc.00g061620.m01.CDS01 [Cosmosporella sp. VM-42]
MLTQDLEQFQYLADKYAPAAPEIAETLAKLQPPPQTVVDSSLPVPLPKSNDRSSQHQIALVIRDGRRVANQLVSLGDASKTTASSRETFSQTSHAETSMSTTLEQDFTVEGKKGHLQCPFSKPASASAEQQDGVADLTPHHSMDPICAAMYAESTSQPAPANGSGGKCPIRYLDKHSPEEVAHYVETHKHELPRSHEVCLRRYQHNEDQIKKIDSKYGDIVSMIEGLGQLHQPMLPEAEEAQQHSDMEQVSNERVENWAQAVSVNTNPEENQDSTEMVDGDRQSHFDRPLKEVRVGESPSRPWGIHVPVYEPSGRDDEQPASPPPAPVRMPSPVRSTQTSVKSPRKCPFDHTKFSALAGLDPPHKLEAHRPPTPEVPQMSLSPTKESFSPVKERFSPTKQPFSPIKETAPPHQSPPQPPAFINPDAVKAAGNMPQMIFTGPVFIGYPMEQAIQFMNQYRGSQ